MKLSEHEIIKYSLIVFISLFVIIFIIDMNYLPEEVNIGDLTSKDINTQVTIYGKIIKQSLKNDIGCDTNNGKVDYVENKDECNSKNMLFITIEDNLGNEIKGILFDFNEKLTIYENFYFIGKISLYNKEFELIVNEVKKDL